MIRAFTSSIRPLTTSSPFSMIATDVQNSFISARMCEEIRIVFPSEASRLRMFLRSIRPLRIDAAGRLVEQQHLGFGNQRLGQHQPLPHAPRELDDRGVSLLGQTDDLEVAVDQRRPLPPRNPVAGGEQVDELPDEKVVVNRRESRA